MSNNDETGCRLLLMKYCEKSVLIIIITFFAALCARKIILKHVKSLRLHQVSFVVKANLTKSLKLKITFFNMCVYSTGAKIGLK